MPDTQEEPIKLCRRCEGSRAFEVKEIKIFAMPFLKTTVRKCLFCGNIDVVKENDV
jgi:hypothetical protein